MNTIPKVVFPVLIFLLIFQSKALLEKSLSVTITEEKLNKISFIHRRDNINGKIQEEWSIDGKKVDFGIYEEALLTAHKEEMRQKRAFERQKQEKEQDYCSQIQCALMAKIVTELLNEVTQELNKIRNPLLENYLQFNEQGFSSPDELLRVEEEIKAFEQKSKDSDVSFQEVKEYSEKLEEIPARLIQCYQDSVAHAIKTCNDTKILKELLTLFS